MNMHQAYAQDEYGLQSKKSSQKQWSGHGLTPSPPPGTYIYELCCSICDQATHSVLATYHVVFYQLVSFLMTSSDSSESDK